MEHKIDYLPDVHNIQEVVKRGLCISCGACAVANGNKIKFEYYRQHSTYLPIISDLKPGTGTGLEFEICPGKGCDLVGLGKKLFGNTAVYDLDLGYIEKTYAVQSADTSVLERASSGGIMTEIALHLLQTGRVSGIIATRMVYTVDGPRPETIIAHTRAEVLECQGSKYIPVPVNLILKDLDPDCGPLAFIGTPCQVESLRMLQERVPEIHDQIPFAISNFCGGFRDYREIDTLLRRHKFRPEAVTYFRFRGGGQPGSLRIEDQSGRFLERPYPDYTKDTGYKKHNRCRLCIDGAAELADFSCGDAWLERFLNTGTPWSVVITRTPLATKIMDDLIELGIVKAQDISLSDIKRSQRSNLHSKKDRQAARRKLFHSLGRALPTYDGGYRTEMTSIWLEARVQISYWALTLLETLHLYPLFSRGIRVLSKRFRMYRSNSV